MRSGEAVEYIVNGLRMMAFEPVSQQKVVHLRASKIVESLRFRERGNAQFQLKFWCSEFLIRALHLYSLHEREHWLRGSVAGAVEALYADTVCPYARCGGQIRNYGSHASKAEARPEIRKRTCSRFSEGGQTHFLALDRCFNEEARFRDNSPSENFT